MGEGATLFDPGIRGATLVAGLGKTGFSSARFLHRLGVPVTVMDSREAPPLLARLRRDLPQAAVITGGFDINALRGCRQVIASPGIDPRGPLLKAARERGIPVLGDVELFARCANAPVVAITGSNGKSTVTALVGAMARAAGWRAGVGGNIGTPALDLLAEDARLYVLELSSYQLETTSSLRAAAAVVLNLSPDHLDRYPGLDAYRAAKARIYRNCAVAVWNRDEPGLARMLPAGGRRLSFGSDAPAAGDFGLRRRDGQRWLAKGDACLLAVDALPMAGEHNVLNALAALALGDAAGLPMAAMLTALRGFTGLPHRMQWVADKGGAAWYDDSKATNVGATQAALAGASRPVVLIAGGVGKGADFRPLRAVLAERARAVVLMGRDAPLLARAWAGTVPLHRADSMEEAVRRAAQLARPGDMVLLSPACASQDMFRDFEERGEAFAAAVGSLPS